LHYCVLENYHTACAKCKGAEYTSALSSAESDIERSRRRDRCRVVLSEESSIEMDKTSRLNSKQAVKSKKKSDSVSVPPQLLRNRINTSGL